MDTVMATNKAAGQFYFEKDTMAFFKSKIESGLYGDRHFVTSEKGPHDKARRYTIREALDGGKRINSKSNFQQYSTLKTAMAAMKELLG